MLDDIHALVQVAETGSIVRAADRLHRTPSAVTRKVQRLEAALCVELLDRTVKPPRLTPLGVRIVEQSKDLLKRVDDLKALTAPATEPAGLLRVGVSHALADRALVKPVRALTMRFPKLRLRLLSELTGDLFVKLQAGELDLAAVFLPEGRQAPSPLLTEVLARDRMVIVERREGRPSRASGWQVLSIRPWVLNPPGCLLRAALVEKMEQARTPLAIAAEIHNMHLQLAFVQAGYGFGLLPRRFIQRHAEKASIRCVELKDFELPMTIAMVRAGPLGSLEAAASELSDSIKRLLAQ